MIAFIGHNLAHELLAMYHKDVAIAPLFQRSSSTAFSCMSWTPIKQFLSPVMSSAVRNLPSLSAARVRTLNKKPMRRAEQKGRELCVKNWVKLQHLI